MNNSESKNIYKKLELIITRLSNVSNPKNYLSIAIGEFSKELYENDQLTIIRQYLKDQAIEQLTPLRIAREKVFQKFDQIVNILRLHQSKFQKLSLYLLKYEEIRKNNISDNDTLIFKLEPLLRDAITEISYNHIYFQRSQITTIKSNIAIEHETNQYLDHSEVIPHLIISNNADKIIYAYSQDLADFYNEFNIFERNKMTTTFYGFYFLIEKYALCYDLRNRSSRIYSLKEEIIKYKTQDMFNFDLTIEADTIAEVLSYKIDIEEYKIHVNRVWEFIKLKLSKNDIFNDSFEYEYSAKIRKLNIYQNNTRIGYYQGNSANLLYYLLEKKSPVTIDEIIESVIKNDESGTDSDKQARNALSSIRKKNILPKNLIICNGNGIWELDKIKFSYSKRIQK